MVSPACNCQDSGLDCDQCQRAYGDNQKGTEAGAFTARNTSNSKHPTFRKTLLKQALTGNYYTFNEQLNYKQVTIFD